MAGKIDPMEIVTFEELLHANTITQEALIKILKNKGNIKKGELKEEIKKVKNSVMKRDK